MVKLVIVAYISMNHPFVTEHAFPWGGGVAVAGSAHVTHSNVLATQRRYLKIRSINEISW